MEPHAERPTGPDIDLRAGMTGGPIDPNAKRFDIFLIDTGWNRPVSRAVRRQLPLIFEFQRQDTLYLLSREQSIELGRRFHELIGHDPMILVYDDFAPGRRRAASGASGSTWACSAAPSRRWRGSRSSSASSPSIARP